MNRVREQWLWPVNTNLGRSRSPRKVERAIAVAGRERSSKEEKNADGLSHARSLACFAPSVNGMLAMHW